MKIINLGETNSVLNKYISELRDQTIQKDPLRFRINLERIGRIFGYEISKQLKYIKKEVSTPLGIAEISVPDEKIVIASLLRAGLPLHKGMLDIFDNAENAFIGTYRKYGKDNKFEIEMEYSSAPSTESKTLIINDTMLATGSSLILAYQKLAADKSSSTHIVCPISSVYGVDSLSKYLPHKNTTLWVGAIDEELTNKSYIVPGLGDAGDLAFGIKE
jgi:uracil phosphoribosyltransferase